MCGIFGYWGPKSPLQVCLAGLKQLEYRGYDSAGIAAIMGGQLLLWKSEGKIDSLEQKMGTRLPRVQVAIGHTRWATHGPPSDLNAHPHLDEGGALALVHNGIVENFAELKSDLQSKGVQFQSETDTEVIAQLLAHHYRGDLLAALQKTVSELKGSFALAAVHREHPEEIVVAARESPLSIGVNDDRTEVLLSSDPNAFLEGKLNILFLRNNELARIRSGAVEIFDQALQAIAKKTERLESDFKPPSKEGFAHYMLKEIYEQPLTLQKALLGRFDNAHVTFEKGLLPDAELRAFKRVWFLGCGTSSHAGEMGAIYLEELAGLPASSDIASEGRYRIPFLSPDTLVVTLSQSGETADTLSALREVKARGGRVLALCNVKNSTMSREADGCLFLKAGPEISVCSTKAFTSQLATLYLFALHMAELQGRPIAPHLAALTKLTSDIQVVLQETDTLKSLAHIYASYENFFFMGRRHMVPTCREAALKLKEISYLNANSYPAGELKHGPIALLSPTFPVIAFTANAQTHEKMVSNLMEVKARGAPILAFAAAGDTAVARIADHTFFLPRTTDPLSPFASSVAGQLFAYFIARARKCAIDQPRNLAKSVTVE